MLQTTNDETLGIKAIGNENNQDIPTSAGRDASSDGESIKNLLTTAKSAKSKESNFVKANSGTDFLTPGAKEAFIHLRKAFTKAPILRHFDPECHIQIETDALGYVIGRVLSQITSDHLDQLFSDHVTYENLNPISSKSKIG